MDNRYIYKKDRGICARCSLPVVNNTRYCQEHLIMQRDYQREYRRKKKRDGICIRPGCKTVTNGSAYCEIHLDELGRYQPNTHRQGLPKREYLKMVENQDGKCAICKQAVKLYVDHDHKTGLIRGLLCKYCNFALGFFKDNQDVMSEAINYLKLNS